MSKSVIEDMSTEHLINRIAWAKRQIIDPWTIHGDEPKYGAGGYMDSVLNDNNEALERHIEKLEEELKKREVEL
jgi:hypothetical protein